MIMLTLSKNFFTSFFHISRLAKKKKKQKRSLLKQQLFPRRYLITIYVLQNKESKKQLFRVYLPVKLVYGKTSIKQGKISSYPYPYLIQKIPNSFMKDKMIMNLQSTIQKTYLRVSAAILNKLQIKLLLVFGL